jgi:outer membrane protein OmpA-like peptidoglycan-associated protein
MFEAFVDHRYLSTAGQSVSFAGRSVDDEYMSHNVFFGIRWTFWREAPPPPVAPPAPAPVARPIDWTVYFEFNKSNLTNAAGAVLDEIKAETSAAQGVNVTGHTDTSGSSQYNDRLSTRRAQTAADGLVKRGVNVTHVSGVGESEPAVQTGDGVKEPLNRRAVVKLDAQQTN